MKKTFLIILISLVFLFMGARLDTMRYGWSKPRPAVATDDTLVSANAATMKFANIPDVNSYKPDTAQNAIEIAWTMHADGEGCVVYVFAARESGDIVLVYQGTLTAGTQVSTDSRYYVDTIVTTTDNWNTAVALVDEGGNNRMSRIVFDTHGYKYFFCQYTGLAGAETVKEYYSGY